MRSLTLETIRILNIWAEYIFGKLTKPKEDTPDLITRWIQIEPQITPLFKSRNKKMCDEDTILKLNEKKSIYKIMPMRFLDKKQYVKILEKNNIHSYYVEELTRTYFKGKDQFTFVIIESFKKSSL